MDDHLKTLLDSVRGRRWFGRYGIRTASNYLGDIAGCFDGGLCATTVFEKCSADQWSKCLKDAETRLTYANSKMAVKRMLGVATPNSILDFECIVTSKKVDRDGDILDPLGAVPDQSMPLLWQHLPMMPIGRSVSFDPPTSKMLAGRFAIADTELGRDAAVLTEFKALRISHGFNPLEFSPREDAKGKQVGWMVNKFEIMETSLVSVPSNTEAVITAFSRGKLHHPLVKSWAGLKFEARSKQVAVGVSIMSDGSVVIEPAKKTKAAKPAETKCGGDCGCDACKLEHDDKAKKPGEKPAEQPMCPECKVALEDGKCPKCGYVMEKANKSGDSKLYTGPVDGSWDWMRGELNEGLKEYLNGHGVSVGKDAGCYVEEMFDDHAIVCVYPDSGAMSVSGEDRLYYSIGWKRTASGPVWEGNPKAVEVTTTVRDKSNHGQKYGRVLSAKNELALRNACELLEDVAMRADVSNPAKVIINGACGKVKNVLEQMESPMNSVDWTLASTDELTAKLLERAAADETVCRKLHQAAGQMLAVTKHQREIEQFEDALAFLAVN